jgi:hypothetical protein
MALGEPAKQGSPPPRHLGNQEIQRRIRNGEGHLVARAEFPQRLGNQHMQRLAAAGQPQNALSAAALPARAVPQSAPVLSAPVVIQRRWQDADRLPTGYDPSGAPLHALQLMTHAAAPNLLVALLELSTIFQDPHVGTSSYQHVQDLLRLTVTQTRVYSTPELIELARGWTAEALGRLPGQNAPDELPAMGHPEDLAADPHDEPITDPNQIKPNELQDEPDVLASIFLALAQPSGLAVSQQAYEVWQRSGPVTRRQFYSILAENPPSGQQPILPIQMRRGPSPPASGPKSYTTDNYGNFSNITYWRNAKGNIEFDSPINRVAGDNWTLPILANSDVNLKKGSNRAGYGILVVNPPPHPPLMTNLSKANRDRHNRIARRIRPDLAAYERTYTWHHRSQEYIMHLVDFTVHQQHGHDGGFLFWRDGQ